MKNMKSRAMTLETALRNASRDTNICDYHTTSRRGFRPMGGGTSANEHTLYMGFELEVQASDTLRNRDDVVGMLRGNFSDVVGLESDGSIGYGVEIVSQPMTLAYHMGKAPWADMLECLNDMGCKGHNAKNEYGKCACGLHVHVTRSALGNTPKAVNRTIACLCVLMKRWFNERPADKLPLTNFSRRDNFTYCHEFGVDFQPTDDRETLENKRKQQGDVTRYLCLNQKHDGTVEFRLFRSTLLPETFAASLQLVECMCRYCMTHTVSDAWRCTFGDVIASCKYDELRAYCAKRGIDTRTTAETAADVAARRVGGEE